MDEGIYFHSQKNTLTHRYCNRIAVKGESELQSRKRPFLVEALRPHVEKIEKIKNHAHTTEAQLGLKLHF